MSVYRFVIIFFYFSVVSNLSCGHKTGIWEGGELLQLIAEIHCLEYSQFSKIMSKVTSNLVTHLVNMAQRQTTSQIFVKL